MAVWHNTVTTLFHSPWLYLYLAFCASQSFWHRPPPRTHVPNNLSTVKLLICMYELVSVLCVYFLHSTYKWNDVCVKSYFTQYITLYDKISFFYGWGILHCVWRVCVYVCMCSHTCTQVKTLKHIHNNFIIHSSIHRKIGCIHILSIINNTVNNTAIIL